MNQPVKANPAVARHPIAVVAERTGLSQDVLRVWERRYDAVHPARTRGGQRLYSDADVERLTILRVATRAGRGIGQVARLSTDAIAAMVNEDMAVRSRREAPRHDPQEADSIVSAALELTRRLDATLLNQDLRRAATRLGIASFIDSIAAPLLRRIGKEWDAGRLTPAQEHLASSIVHDIIVDVMRSVRSRDDAPRIVVTALAGERHVIGAALIGAAAATAGVNVIYLGADLPVAEIAEAARLGAARAVAVSVVYLDDRDRVLSEIRSLRSRLPANVDLITGGAGADSIAKELAALGVRVQSGLGAWLAELQERRAGA